MTNTKSNISFGALKEKFKKNGRYFGFGTSPKHDWKIIFFSALLCKALVIGLCVYVFVMVNRGAIFQAQVEEKVAGKPLETKLLEETVSYYLNKQVEFDRIIKTRGSSTDPTI